MATLAGGWVAAQDPSSGRTYYANPVTGATSWEVPAEVAAAAAIAAAASAAPVLPPGWVAATDPSSGRTYYVNAATNSTSWEFPTHATGPASPVSQKARLSLHSRAVWRKVLDYARQEATTRLQAKSKRFQGMRKFADLAAKRKAEAAAKKKREAEEEEARAAREAAEAGRPKKSILQLLDVDVPPSLRLNIEEYAEEHFNLNRKGMFGAKTTVGKVLSWKNEVIQKALLKLPTRDLDNIAVQTFRNVTGFMGDRSSKKEETGHAEKLLKACQGAPEELRDEVYCQIIKQTTNNPSPESTLKGWQLMGVCTGAFAPSKDFEPYLASYCEAHREDGAGVGEYATYALGRIKKTSELGPRKEVPTDMELEASKLRLPVLVRVYHLDGTFDVLPVSSWVTPGLLKQMVCEKRGILDGSAFGIYEMTPEGEERALDQDERILDLISYWQRLFEEERDKNEDAEAKKAKKKGEANFYRVVFKVAMYFEPAVEDKAAAHEMYVQAVYDVISARYPCGERDCVALAGLQLQAEYGNAGLPDLAAKLGRFMPDKYASSTRTTELANEISKSHREHENKTAADAEAEYLAYVKEWQVYGSSFFFVEPQMNNDLPVEVFLAVNPKGVLIINPDTKEVLATHPYNEVPTWGHSGTSFVLHIGNLIRQNKLYFATEQGKEINNLVREYVNHLCIA